MTMTKQRATAISVLCAAGLALAGWLSLGQVNAARPEDVEQNRKDVWRVERNVIQIETRQTEVDRRLQSIEAKVDRLLERTK